MKGPIRTVASVIVVAALAVASYSAGRWLRSYGLSGPSAAWAQQAVALTATAKRIIEGGEEKGEVYMGERMLFRVDTAAGGLTGYERAMIIAKRLNDAFAAGARPEDFRAQVVHGLNAVVWRDKPLITIDNAQAEALGKDRAQVAEEWAAAIRTAMREALGLPPEPPKPPSLGAQEGGQAAGQGQAQTQPQAGAQTGAGGTEAEAKAQQAEQTEASGKQQPEGETKSAEWQPSEPYDKKIVPIISVGEGIQVGAAQVKGPRSRVKLVQACALLETHYKRTLEIDIYVPISTKKPGKTLARVQGVGVVALGKYKLTGHR